MFWEHSPATLIKETVFQRTARTPQGLKRSHFPGQSSSIQLNKLRPGLSGLLEHGDREQVSAIEWTGHRGEWSEVKSGRNAPRLYLHAVGT